MRIRDGPAAVRGVAPSPETTGLRAGKVAEGGAPSQKTFRAAANPEPLAEGGFVSRRLITLGAALALVAALATPALAARVKVRVEGKTTTIFGALHHRCRGLIAGCLDAKNDHGLCYTSMREAMRSNGLSLMLRDDPLCRA